MTRGIVSDFIQIERYAHRGKRHANGPESLNLSNSWNRTQSQR
jgi:hypothetical protein